MNRSIGAGTAVTLHFALTLTTGEVVDSTFEKAPATFVMGDGSLLPGFERKLIGLAVGDKREFIVEKQDAFGVVNPDNVHTFRQQDFPQGMRLEPGLVVSFANPSNRELSGVVREIREDGEVVVDFNHPLAGQDLRFQVEIIHVL